MPQDKRLVFDVETQKELAEVGGFRNVHMLGISVVGVYTYQDDTYKAYEEKDLLEILSFFDTMVLHQAPHCYVKLFAAPLSQDNSPAIAQIVASDALADRGGLTSIYKEPGIYTNDAIKMYFDNFAKCISDKGAVMYGAMEWCKYTQGQRAMFGKSFKYVNYHEFTELPGIMKTPTWVIDGKWYENAQSFDKLSGLTGCKI